MRHPFLVRLGAMAVSCMITYSTNAEEEVSLEFLEFLGGMVGNLGSFERG